MYSLAALSALNTVAAEKEKSDFAASIRLARSAALRLGYPPDEIPSDDDIDALADVVFQTFDDTEN